MKQQKRVLVLNSAEYRLMLYGLIQFRNKLIQQGRYTDVVDELLIKLQKAGGTYMDNIAKRLKAYIDTHPFDPGDSEVKTVLDQIYQAYAESHESDPPEIQAGFAELETFLEKLPMDDNNAVFNLCCRLCIHYEHKAFYDGLHYGVHLMVALLSRTVTSQ